MSLPHSRYSSASLTSWLLLCMEQQAFTPKEYNRLPPALPRKGLGSCAIVGHSDRLLGQTRGFEIDAHTTVIRVGFFLRKAQRSPPVQLPSGPPVNGFEMHVGYKTDFVFLPNGRVYTAPRMPQNTNTTMWQTQEWQVKPCLTGAQSGCFYHSTYYFSPSERLRPWLHMHSPAYRIQDLPDY